MSVVGKKIVVIGAGMGGLSFAIALESYSKELNAPIESVTILERDGKVDEKDFQNYSLSIRTDSGGVQALEKLGVLEDAMKFQTHATDGFYMATHTDTDYKVLFVSPKMVPEFSGFRPIRYGLWKSLLGHVPQSTPILWGKNAVRVTQDSSNEHPITVHLDDDSTIEADLVVVADGSQSAVRNSLLPDEKPSFSGLVLLCGTTNQDPPQMLTNKHGLVLGNDGVAMFVAHEGPNKTLWSVTCVASEPHPPLRVRTATKEQQQEVLKEAVSKLTTWPEDMRQLVAAADLSTVRVVNGYDKPPHHSLDRVVFIGDSNHPVTPFSGNGANMALVDGVSLAKELTNPQHSTIEQALQAFDKEMFPRATEVIRQGRHTISMAHAQSFFSTTSRNSLLRTLNFVVHHPSLTKAVGLGVTVAVIAAVGVWWTKRNPQ